LGDISLNNEVGLRHNMFKMLIQITQLHVCISEKSIISDSISPKNFYVTLTHRKEKEKYMPL